MEPFGEEFARFRNMCFIDFLTFDHCNVVGKRSYRSTSSRAGTILEANMDRMLTMLTQIQTSAKGENTSKKETISRRQTF